MDKNLNQRRTNLNFEYNKNFTDNYDKNIIQKNYCENNMVRMDNLEDRILSLEKMLQCLDEFIHLKEEQKNNDLESNLIVEQLKIKIDLLEKEIRTLYIEKNENKKIIMELNNKILNLERQINNNNMHDIAFSLSNKEKQLNLLINDFQDMSKKSDLIINNKLTEKINEFNVFNEKRISELLSLIQNINSVLEENEFKINKINDNIQNIQKDNLNLIKIMSIQEQKFNNFELINNEINSIKEKIRILIDDYNLKIENSFVQNY